MVQPFPPFGNPVTYNLGADAHVAIDRALAGGHIELGEECVLGFLPLVNQGGPHAPGTGQQDDDSARHRQPIGWPPASRRRRAFGMQIIKGPGGLILCA